MKKKKKTLKDRRKTVKWLKVYTVSDYLNETVSFILKFYNFLGFLVTRKYSLSSCRSLSLDRVYFDTKEGRLWTLKVTIKWMYRIPLYSRRTQDKKKGQEDFRSPILSSQDVSPVFIQLLNGSSNSL